MPAPALTPFTTVPSPGDATFKADSYAFAGQIVVFATELNAFIAWANTEYPEEAPKITPVYTSAAPVGTKAAYNARRERLAEDMVTFVAEANVFLDYLETDLLTALPDAPSTTDTGAVFSSKAFAWDNGLAALVVELNEFVAWVNVEPEPEFYTYFNDAMGTNNGGSLGPIDGGDITGVRSSGMNNDGEYGSITAWEDNTSSGSGEPASYVGGFTGIKYGFLRDESDDVTWFYLMLDGATGTEDFDIYIETTGGGRTLNASTQDDMTFEDFDGTLSAWFKYLGLDGGTASDFASNTGSITITPVV